VHGEIVGDDLDEIDEFLNNAIMHWHELLEIVKERENGKKE